MAVEEITTKRCPKCGETKTLGEFSKHAGRYDGLQSRCKECGKAYNAARYADNPDKCKVANDKWGAANPGREKACKAKWKADNREACRIHWQNRQARKREAGGKLSKGLASKLVKLQQGKCACGCKQPLGNDRQRLPH